MDEPTAARVISTIADLIKQASACQVTKAVTLGNKAKALVASIPADQKKCFMNDPTGKIIASGLGISVASPEKSMDKLVQKAIRYAIGHFSEVCKSLKGLNSDASSGNWQKFGVNSAITLKKVLA
jgi:isocitrate dehydrogenase